LAVLDVSGWRAGHQEGMGSKAKVWLGSPTGERWLFKYARGGDDLAENWSEKVAAETRGRAHFEGRPSLGS
jgi:hypothetical protein